MRQLVVAVGLNPASLVGQIDQSAVVSTIELDGLGLVVAGARVRSLNTQLLGVTELILEEEVTLAQLLFMIHRQIESTVGIWMAWPSTI